MYEIKQLFPAHLRDGLKKEDWQEELEEIRVQMTYCNIDTEEIRYFHSESDNRSSFFMEKKAGFLKKKVRRSGFAWNGMRGRILIYTVHPCRISRR